MPHFVCTVDCTVTVQLGLRFFRGGWEEAGAGLDDGGGDDE